MEFNISDESFNSEYSSSSGFRMSKQVVRLKDLKEKMFWQNDSKPSISQSNNFILTVFSEFSIFDEIEQMQYYAAELQGQMKDIGNENPSIERNVTKVKIFNLCI